MAIASWGKTPSSGFARFKWTLQSSVNWEGVDGRGLVLLVLLWP